MDDDDEDDDDEDESEQGERGAGSDMNFICPFNGCEKTFSRKIRLNAHMHLHYGT